MSRIPSLILSLVLFSTQIIAHEHWLATDKGQYDPGEAVEIVLKSGHQPGASEFLLEDKLIREAYVRTPGGKQINLDFEIVDLHRHATIQAGEPGVYVVIVNLRKRSSGPHIYLMKTVFSVGTANAFQAAASQALELVGTATGNTLQVRQGDSAVITPISWLEPGTEGRSLNMDRTGLSSLPEGIAGYQVFVTHFRRQSASLGLWIHP